MNNGKICVSVCAGTTEELSANIRRAEPLADVIEVRFDYLPAGHVELFRSQISNIKFEKPLIATHRSPEQGGRSFVTREERRAFWNDPIPGFWAVDVEEDPARGAKGQFRIVSFHDLNGVPSDIDGLFDRLYRPEADAVKIAVQTNDITDAILVWKLIARGRSLNKQVIPIAMGEAGKWTRILGLAHGAYMTYASLDEGKETAEGQTTVRDLIDVYRVKDLDESTQVYGVIGDPVSESLSPYIHNPAFAAAGLNAVFIPLLVKDLDAFITRMVLPASREVELNFAGFAVTMPHKQAVMKYLDGIDEAAEKIGAVNTVKIDNDRRLIGYNTDADGFLAALKQAGCEVKRNNVAVIGAGGAARACLYVLRQESADVTILARDADRGKALADEFGVPFRQLATGRRSLTAEFDIVVNATPLGMKGPLEKKSPLTADELKGVKLVVDLVTRSNDTPLICEAKLAGIPTMPGVEMLIAQGARQIEIWTGREAPVELMRAAVLSRMEKIK